MVRDGDGVRELEVRRRALIEEADRLSDALDVMPSPGLRLRMREVAASIDRLDRELEGRRGPTR